jgi:hypothetical protein
LNNETDIMKALLNSSAFLFLCLAIGAASCSRPPERLPVKVDSGKEKPVANPYQAFIDSVRFTENARAGEDWTRFRSSFDLLGGEIAKPEVIQRIREATARNRPFLEADVHLTPDELHEVESLSFRTADAHYLDECFLLRDVHRSIEVNDLPPLAQADVHFRWVMRNVLLHEEFDSMIPPAFTLRRGYGSALDRALVFLALLRQAQIEGCLIVVPDAMPQQFLVGVPDSNRASALLFASTFGVGASPLGDGLLLSALAAAPGRVAPDLFLFDTRLGLPLKSKDQKRWLTLDEARHDPDSLQAAKITPKQVETLEAWLVCPLYALAPRLKELQRGLSDRDTITLYVDAKRLRDDIAQAARIPVKVWNPPAKDKELANSPTRSLRMFLAKQEGGIDETRPPRAVTVAQSRIPYQTVMSNFARINMDTLPKPVFDLLNGITGKLFNQYDLQTREMYLRGLHDAMIRRQERMLIFARDDSLARLRNDAKFHKEAAEWREKVVKAHAGAVDDRNPASVRSAAQQTMLTLCAPDPFIRWLSEINNEEKLDNKIEKTVVTKILAVGMREYFESELARSQACANHEAAVHAQATLTSLREQGKATAATGKTTNDAWVIARSSWSNFYLDNISLESMIKRRLEQLRNRIQLRELGPEIDQRVGMLEVLHRDVQKYFHAKLCLAECIEHLQGPNASDEYLLAVRAEIEELEKKGVLRAELEQVQKALRQMQQVEWATKRLDFLANDWSDPGSYDWMKRQIEQRAKLP